MTRVARVRDAQLARLREADLIAQWRGGAWLGWQLRADDGARYTLVFQGRPGGPAGPDFRDAVLVNERGERIIGDIELHLSPAGWRAHGHSADPRYNGLALHVTLTSGRHADATVGALANGRRAPLVVLSAQDAPALPSAPPPSWPCAGFGSQPAAARRDLLRDAGRERFEERVATFSATLDAPLNPSWRPPAGWGAAESALVVALAEGLGYGRDRTALRACGERLARGEPPDALLSEVSRLGAVERTRLSGLLVWLDRWYSASPLVILSGALVAGSIRRGASGAARAVTEALQVKPSGAVSPGRARILAFNVALPFVAAWARATMRDEIAALATAAAAELPGLPSNQITREMARQLGLSRLPSGALTQQGAHHIWARWCREKMCATCPCASPATLSPR
jgi:hypothetical protein